MVRISGSHSFLNSYEHTCYFCSSGYTGYDTQHWHYRNFVNRPLNKHKHHMRVSKSEEDRITVWEDTCHLTLILWKHSMSATQGKGGSTELIEPPSRSTTESLSTGWKLHVSKGSYTLTIDIHKARFTKLSWGLWLVTYHTSRALWTQWHRTAQFRRS